MAKRDYDGGSEHGQLDDGVDFHPVDAPAIEHGVDLMQRDKPDPGEGRQSEHDDGFGKIVAAVRGNSPERDAHGANERRAEDDDDDRLQLSSLAVPAARPGALPSEARDPLADIGRSGHRHCEQDPARENPKARPRARIVVAAPNFSSGGDERRSCGQHVPRGPQPARVHEGDHRGEGTGPSTSPRGGPDGGLINSKRPNPRDFAYAGRVRCR